MSDNIKILRNYLLYFLSLLLVCIVGISNVFADNLENIGYLNDYSNVFVEVSYTGHPLELQRLNEYQLGQVEAMNINIYNYNFIGGTSYIIEFYTPNTTLSYANAFTAAGLTSNNQEVTCSTTGIGYHDSKYLDLKFNCPNTVNYISLRIFNNQNNYIMDTGLFSWHYVYLRKVNSGTDTSILESQNAQIIQGQQDIINNQTQNTQDIINNQNANTDKEIESQLVCKLIEKNDEWSKGYLSSSGVFTSESSSSTYNYASPYFELDDNSKIRVVNNSTVASRTCFYDINKDFISCKTASSMVVGENLVIPSNTKYFRSTYNINTGRPKLELCKNGNQALNDSINDLNNTLNNDSPIDVSSLGNTVGWLPAGPIDSIINLPLNFFNSISSALSGTCSPLNLSIPYINTNISIPCLSTIFGQINGLTSFWNWVGRIASIYILYKYLLALWDYYDRLTTLQVNFRDDFGGGI